MEKKVKNLKTGDLFEVTMPDGAVRHCQMACASALKGATKMVIGKDGEHGVLTLFMNDKVKFLGNFGMKPGIAEAAKEQFEKEKKEKEENK